MAWTEDEAIGPDVASAGLHVSERIGRDAAAQPNLEEGPRGLTPRGHASHPYSSYPNEVGTPEPIASREAEAGTKTEIINDRLSSEKD
uniref:Uncharacterized protein n=1 Tax=Oryza rufipogon TaxID=4529 RepID=A0A0E0NRU0_ORYRU